MLIFKESDLKGTFNYLKNFGFKNEFEVVMPGTNAKMSEMQALMGTQLLKYIEESITTHSKITELYRHRLKEVPGIRLVPNPSPEIRHNHAYMPIEVDEHEFGMSCETLYKNLRKYNVYARRYFYPLICDYACYRSVSIKDPLTVARRVSDRILTLPIYNDLQLSDVDAICEIIMSLHLGKRYEPTDCNC